MVTDGKHRRSWAINAVAPYTSAFRFLNNAGMNFVLWGDHALYLAFGIPNYHHFTDIDIVIADDDVVRAATVLEENGYLVLQETPYKIETVFFTAFHKSGKFPEVSVLKHSCGNNKSVVDGLGHGHRCRLLNLIPASLVMFETNNRAYRQLLDYVDPKSKIGWLVPYPTLAGLLDAAMSLMREYESDEEEGYCWRRFLGDLMSGRYNDMSDEEIRKVVLWTHGNQMWTRLQTYAYGKRAALTIYDSFDDLPSTMERVAALLGRENRDFYLELCVIALCYGCVFWSASRGKRDKGWLPRLLSRL
ncbi:hypothetical protein BJ508DRAFT_306091 [Ascobolus immersus RN42]|uniref:Nucleotidyltransferase family protein n=1 Tax=Ascobolus immersus RN42 TaxID=1160509 RepID=A0A3N4I775_ASCIM|nr:hypothetical protein BJ508DRAFT_306091 [Ascobolus immersus RN42]